MGLHYDDCDPRQVTQEADRAYNSDRAKQRISGSSIGDAIVRGGATGLRGAAPTPNVQNKRGQIESQLEVLAVQVQTVLGFAERIHSTLLGYDAGKNANGSATAAVPAGIMAQQLEVLHALSARVIDTRQLLENIAAEIGA